MSQSNDNHTGSTARQIVDLEKRCRALGICLFYDTDGEIYGLPGDVFNKYPLLRQECVTHEKGLKQWLRILVSQSHAT